MKIFCTKLILFALCMEIVVRLLCHAEPDWYQLAVRDIQNNSARSTGYIFIGSSRVYSIITDDFIQTLGESESSVTVLNMAAGSSTLMEHYFGIRRIADARPDGLKGMVVFLEAPAGAPELETWQTNWFNPDSPELLLNTLCFSDLRSFLAHSDSDLGEKMTIVIGMLSKTIANRGNGSMLVPQIKYIAQKIQTRISPKKSDLSSSGGIRTDEAGIQNSRSLAVNYAARALSNQQILSLKSDDKPVLKDLNDLVLARGGKLILFKMPLSSVLSQIQNSAIGRENLNTAHALLKDWSIPLLYPDFRSKDDNDFPDYWHLRHSLSSEFTQSLAQAYGDFRKTDLLSGHLLQ